MPYGLYISAEGAAAQNHRMQVLAHNLANVDTPGFKRELAVLEARHAEAIQQGLDYPGSRSINDVGGGVLVRRTLNDFAKGTLKKTDIPTDMAIDGDGFFEVQRDGQTFLTRAGNFRLDASGLLKTQDGYAVLAEGGTPIQLDVTLPWQLNKNGVISQAGSSIPLSLVKPASLGDLVRVGQNLFSPLADTIPLSQTQRRVSGGTLEQSGVKPTTEMMELIEASRAFEANIKLIQNHDNMIDSLLSRVLRGA